MLIEQKMSDGPEIVNSISFKNDICHECNKQTPSLGYTAGYGGTFEQNYGWYINKQSYEFGVMPVAFKILDDVCPDEIFSLLDISRDDFLENYNGLSELQLIFAQARDSYFQKRTRRIRKIIENEVRVRFGFKKVGEAWTTETVLYQLVCQIFPQEKIYRHFRPDFLDFLELDIFIPSLNLGIEYQGIQHFKPVDHWGGEDSLKRLKKRDKRKKILCEKNNIKLICFYYYEEISKDSVENKLLQSI